MESTANLPQNYDVVHYRNQILLRADAARDRLVYIYSAGEMLPHARAFHEFTEFHFHLLEYIVSGKGYILQNGKMITVGEGDAVFIREKSSVAFYADSTQPYHKKWFCVCGSQIEHLLSMFRVTEDVAVVQAPVETMFDEIQAQLLRDDGDELALAVILLRLCYAVFHAQTTPDPAKSDASHEHLALADRIKREIAQMSLPECSPKTISSRLNVSPRHLSRVFKKQYGMTVCQYLEKCRIEQAAHLLSETALPVCAIAAQLNFCNQNYFSLKIRRAFGCTPTAYRQRARDAATENLSVAEQAVHAVRDSAE